MGVAQWVLVVMILFDAFGFLYRNAKNGAIEEITGIVITAFFIKYNSIVWVLYWGGFWNV